MAGRADVVDDRIRGEIEKADAVDLIGWNDLVLALEKRRRQGLRPTRAVVLTKLGEFRPRRNCEIGRDLWQAFEERHVRRALPELRERRHQRRRDRSGAPL